MTNFKLDFSVRDYECDIEKIVNNATYLNYLEHTRHEYLQTLGINFAQMHSKGINLVVVRAEIDYNYPLTSGDKFYVTANMVLEGKIRFVFYQEIYRVPDEKLILKAKITGTSISPTGRPFMPDEFKQAIQNYQ